MKANLSNYKKVEKFLKDNDIEFVKVNQYQYRILGELALVDLWPARMTCHVIRTEAVDPNRYFRLDYHFKPAQLKAILEGRKWK